MKRWMFRAWGWLPLPDFLRRMILWLGLPKFLVGASAIIFNESEEVLLFRHTYRPDDPWGVPGGWLNRREDPAVAVEREVWEEAGLRVRARYPLIVYTVPRESRLDMYFLCDLVGGTFRASPEVSDARFFPLEALPEPFDPFIAEVIAYAHCQSQHPRPDTALPCRSSHTCRRNQESS